MSVSAEVRDGIIIDMSKRLVQLDGCISYLDVFKHNTVYCSSPSLEIWAKFGYHKSLSGLVCFSIPRILRPISSNLNKAYGIHARRSLICIV